MIYTTKNDMWTDESGMSIPLSRITGLERKTESSISRIYKDAKALSEKLEEFKSTVKKLMLDIYDKSLTKAGVDSKKGKGNFTAFSFDRSIKVIAAIQDRIDFDSTLIEAAQIKLNKYLKEQLGGVDPFVQQLINSAFEKTGGELDTKKVLSLLKYKTRSNSVKFQEAMDLINRSIRRPDSKQYFRVFERDENGEYHLINLNFSAL
jgi:hypothetical protein